MSIKETTPILHERRRGCGDLCKDYGEAVQYGVCRKKTLSADLENVLKTNLKRCLNTCDLIAYGLAAMLGGSIYVLTGAVMHKRTGPAVFLAYVIAGAVALLNAMIYSELACRIPKAGSSYSYAYILLGELLAFLTGWSILLEYILGTATVARGWSSMLDGLTGNRISQWIIANVGRLGPRGGILAEYPDLIGVTLIIIVASISCCGVRGSARVTGVFIFINFCVLLITSIYMFVFSNPNNLNLPRPANVTDADPFTPNPNFLPFGMGGLIGGVAICFNAFIGFDAISTCAEETQEPSKSLPTANFAAVFFVSVITMLASLALAMYYPWYLISPEVPFLMALRDNIQGGSEEARNGMFYFVGVGCLIGLTSSLLSNLIAGPRINYAMSEDGLLPRFCSNVCQPFQTPAVATTFVALTTALLDLLFSVESLADFLSLGTLIAYSIASIGLLTLRYGTPPERRGLAKSKAVSDPLPSIDGTTDSQLVEQILNDKNDELQRIGQPGYLKQSWAQCMSVCTIKFFNSGPPGNSISFLTGIYLVVMALLIMTVKLGAPESIWPVWRIVIVCILLVALGTLIVLMCGFVQQRSPRRDLFRLPLVPLFPCATLSVNMFLIAELSWITWVRFAIWLAIGLIIYFTYGVCHSSGAAQEGHSWALGTPPQRTESSPNYVVAKSR